MAKKRRPPDLLRVGDIEFIDDSLVTRGPIREAVTTAIEDGRWRSASMIAEACGRHVNAVGKELARMMREGMVEPGQYGRVEVYRLVRK